MRLAALERRRRAWANALISFKTEGRGVWGPAGLYLSLCQSSQRWSAHGTKCQAREVGPGPRRPLSPGEGCSSRPPRTGVSLRLRLCHPGQPLPARPGCSEKAASDGEGCPGPGLDLRVPSGRPWQTGAPLGCEPAASTHWAPRLCKACLLGVISPTPAPILQTRTWRPGPSQMAVPGGG